MEETAGGSKDLGVELDHFNTVQLGVYGTQLAQVPGPKVTAAGLLRHGDQGLFVQILGRVHSSGAKDAFCDHSLSAKRDGVNFNVVLSGEIGGALGREHTGVISAIGAQDQYALVIGPLSSTLHRQAVGVANGAALTGKADLACLQ